MRLEDTAFPLNFRSSTFNKSGSRYPKVFHQQMEEPFSKEHNKYFFLSFNNKLL